MRDHQPEADTVESGAGLNHDAEPLFQGLIDDFRDIDPTLHGHRDPEVQVWEERAFPGFGLPSDRETVRRIVASSQRRAVVQSREVVGAMPLLPSMGCGAPLQDGKRCGRMVRSVWLADKKRFLYRGIRCHEAHPAHRTDFYATAQTAILEIIAQAYDASAVRRLLENIGLRAGGLRRRMRDIATQLATLDAEINGIAEVEAQAAAAQDPEEMAFWKQRRIPVLTRQRALRQENAQIQERIRGMEEPGQMARQLRIATRLAADLPALFARAAQFRGRTQELVNLLVRRMAIRQVTPGLMLFELELPTGQISHHLLVTDNFRCSQPERLFAFASLAAGQDPAATAQRLGDERRYKGEARMADGETVYSFALLHAYFETVAPREGSHTSVAQLAEQLRVPRETIWNAGLEGRLGPARLGADGGLTFCPTEEEQLRLSPWIGQLEVAARLQTTPEDLVWTGALTNATGLTSEALRDAGVKKQHGGTDRAGRRFIRRHAIPPHLLEELEHSSPERRAARLRSALVGELARADFDPSEVTGWHRQDTALAVLRERLGYGSVHTFGRAAKCGHITRMLLNVPESVQKKQTLALWIYIPRAVLYEGAKDEVLAWLQGKGPHPTRTGDGRHQRVNRRGRRGSGAR